MGTAAPWAQHPDTRCDRAGECEVTQTATVKAHTWKETLWSPLFSTTHSQAQPVHLMGKVDGKILLTVMRPRGKL